jgi:hypothetical protein
MSSLFRARVQNPEQKNILSHLRSAIDHDDSVVRCTGGPIVGRGPIGIQPRKIRRIRRAGIFCLHASLFFIQLLLRSRFCTCSCAP